MCCLDVYTRVLLWAYACVCLKITYTHIRACVGDGVYVRVSVMAYTCVCRCGRIHAFVGVSECGRWQCGNGTAGIFSVSMGSVGVYVNVCACLCFAFYECMLCACMHVLTCRARSCLRACINDDLMLLVYSTPDFCS
jgi:hypothetical protein